ncbi:MAG: helix-turn-helix domain-containing protein [Lachnospiraceae bacterium]|nr:helix-turn-helix domain-containing protein [Lachnospiraceae bacterium]
MVTNQAIITMLKKTKEATNVSLEVYSIGDVLITPDGTHHAPNLRELIRRVNDAPDGTLMDDRIYFRVNDQGRLQYLVSCNYDEISRVVAKMAVIQIAEMFSIEEGRFGREHFFKNLLMDNLLITDIYHQANKLHIDVHSKRVAYLVELHGKDSASALEVVESLFADDERIFTAVVDENHIALIREVGEDCSEEELKSTASMIVDMLNTELMEAVTVSYGNVADEIRKVSVSFKEAKIALSVGRIFSPERNVVGYQSLGIGRLIYQLPVPMCKMFISEIFKGESPEKFDEEILMTINEFFANNLNVSETSRKLYCHRNTLVYRLNKIQRQTGLDLTNFDDAITFKIALMVVRYMSYMESQEN